MSLVWNYLFRGDLGLETNWVEVGACFSGRWEFGGLSVLLFFGLIWYTFIMVFGVSWSLV